MKRSKILLCAVLLFLAGVLFYQSPLRSALDDLATLGYDTPNARDVWRVNSSGHFIPGADNTYNIGSAANSVGTLTADGAVTLGNTLTLTGAATLNGNLTLDDLLILQLDQIGTGIGATQGIYTSTTITPTSTFMVLTGSAAVSMTMLSTPHISTSAATEGTLLVLISTSSTIIFQDENTLESSALELGATTRALGPNDVLSVIYRKDPGEAGKWRELFFSNND